MSLKISNMPRRKGISPLIASVILIAITFAIAGILTTWAFTFVSQKGSAMTQQQECIGALDVDTRPPSLVYSSGNLTIILSNTKTTTTLTDLTAFAILPDPYILMNYTLGLNLEPRSSSAKILTGLPAKPLRIRIASANCEGFLADVAIP